MKRSICTIALTATFSIAMAQGSTATDNCNDAVAVLLEDGTPVTLTGDNSAATSMGDFDPNSPVYGAEAVWHAFTTTVCMDVSIAFCGQTPAWTGTWGFLFTDCPGMDLLSPDAFNNDACGDGNVTYHHWTLVPGTYYFAVPRIDGSTGEYSIELTGIACPSGGVNDLCMNVQPVALEDGVPVQFTGDNSFATTVNDFEPGSPVSGAAVVWHAFTIDVCTTVILDYCGQTPVWEQTWGFLFADCPGNEVISPDQQNVTVCGDGNVTYEHWELFPGTYYIAVPLVGTSEGDYVINVTGTFCPSGNEHDLCMNIDPVTLASGSSIEFNGDNSTATTLNDFAPTSPVSGAAANWHAFTITTCMDVTFDLCGQSPVWEETWGFLFTQCPADSLIIPDDVNTTDCTDGNNTYDHWDLEPGTYYIAVPQIAGSTGAYTIHVSGDSCQLNVGVADAAAMQWSIFPNPTEGTFTIANSDDHEIRSVEIIDMAGRVVSTLNERIAPRSRSTIDAAQLPQGMYVVRVTTKAREQFQQRLSIR